MRFTQTLLGFLSLASVLPGVLSLPAAEPNAVALSKRYTGTPKGKDGSGGPATSDYDSDDAIRSAYTSPSGASVFFSQIGDSTPAYNFAINNGGFIFRGAYPNKYTNRNGRSKEWYQDFCDRFSGVFAEKASGEVFFVAPFDDEIDSCRVWNRIEFPSLKDNPAVTKITLVDYKDFSKTKTLWERSARLAIREAFDSLSKRDDSCPDWTDDEDGMDPANDDSGSDSDSDSDLSDVDDVF